MTEVISCIGFKKSHSGSRKKNAHRKTWAEAIRRLYDPILKEPIPQRIKATLRRGTADGHPAIPSQDARTHNSDDG